MTAINARYQQDAVAAALTALVPPALAGQTWGIAAYDLANQEQIIAYNAD